MPRPPSTKLGRTSTGYPMSSATRHGAVGVDRGAVARGEEPCRIEDVAEQLALLGEIDRLGAGAEDAVAGILDPLRESERRLAAELADDAEDLAGLRLGVEHLEHVLERQRLEVEAIARVVVGRDGLGVAVDHDGLVAGVRQRERRVHARVVELDALADAVRAGPDDDDLGALGGLHLGLVVVARVVVRRQRRELPRAGVDGLVDRAEAQSVTDAACLGLGDAPQLRRPARR